MEFLEPKVLKVLNFRTKGFKSFKSDWNFIQKVLNFIQKVSKVLNFIQKVSKAIEILSKKFQKRLEFCKFYDFLPKRRYNRFSMSIIIRTRILSVSSNSLPHSYNDEFRQIQRTLIRYYLKYLIDQFTTIKLHRKSKTLLKHRENTKIAFPPTFENHDILCGVEKFSKPTNYTVWGLGIGNKNV